MIGELGPGPGRDIWISSGPLERAGERSLALAALRAGWAVLREPAERLPAATLLWARPTIVSGTAAELDELLAAVAAEAPRWGARRWLRRRLARLRALVLEGDRTDPERPELPERLEIRLAELGAVARVLPLPGGGW